MSDSSKPSYHHIKNKRHQKHAKKGSKLFKSLGLAGAAGGTPSTSGGLFRRRAQPSAVGTETGAEDIENDDSFQKKYGPRDIVDNRARYAENMAENAAQASTRDLMNSRGIRQLSSAGAQWDAIMSSMLEDQTDHVENFFALNVRELESALRPLSVEERLRLSEFSDILDRSMRISHYVPPSFVIPTKENVAKPAWVAPKDSLQAGIAPTRVLPSAQAEPVAPSASQPSVAIGQPQKTQSSVAESTPAQQVGIAVVGQSQIVAAQPLQQVDVATALPPVVSIPTKTEDDDFFDELLNTKTTSVSQPPASKSSSETVPTTAKASSSTKENLEDWLDEIL